MYTTMQKYRVFVTPIIYLDAPLKMYRGHPPKNSTPFPMSDTRLEIHKNPLHEIIDHSKLLLEWEEGEFTKRPVPKLMTAAHLQQFGKHSVLTEWLHKRFGREVRYQRGKDDLHSFLWSLFVHAPFSRCGSYHFYTMADLDRLLLENDFYWIDDFVASQFKRWWALFSDKCISCELFYDVPTTLRFQAPMTYEDSVLAVVKYVNTNAMRKWTKTHFTDAGELIPNQGCRLYGEQQASHKSIKKSQKKCKRRTTSK